MNDLLIHIKLNNRLLGREELLRKTDEIAPDALENIIPLRLNDCLRKNKIQHKEIKNFVDIKQTMLSKSYALYLLIKDIKFFGSKDLEYICDRIIDSIIKPYEDKIQKYQVSLLGIKNN